MRKPCSTTMVSSGFCSLNHPIKSNPNSNLQKKKHISHGLPSQSRQFSQYLEDHPYTAQWGFTHRIPPSRLLSDTTPLRIIQPSRSTRRRGLLRCITGRRSAGTGQQPVWRLRGAGAQRAALAEHVGKVTWGRAETVEIGGLNEHY